MGESSQSKIGRNRPPRVHISYNVDVGDDVTELKEIPFVMGVLSDLSGDREEDPVELADRKFSEVNAHTFNTFLKSQKPRVVFQVDNALTGEGQLNVDMTFESLEDFSPAAVARKVEGLKQLFEDRQVLAELLTKMGSRPKLEKALQALNNPELVRQILDQSGGNTPA